MAAKAFPSRKNRMRQRSFWRGFKTVKFNKILNNLLALAAVVIMAAASFLSAVYYIKSLENYSVPVSVQFGTNHYSWFKWRDVLFAGIPGLSYSIEETVQTRTVSDITAKKAVNWFILFFTNVNFNDKHSLLVQEIPLLISVERPPANPASGSAIVENIVEPPVNSVKNNNTSAKLSDKPLVCIYHTHTAESFIPTSGVSHKPGGQLGDITIVGSVLAEELKKRGIISVHSKTVHDHPSFMKAYGSSVITAEKMLAENPTTQVILDIHRDADKRQNSIININGQEAAKISIVIAKGQEDLPQPLWPQNYEFAKLIDAKLTKYYPGLSKGIQFSEWRYNQHLHPRALLIEVGCQENSLEETSYSMQLLAEALAEILKENKY